MARTCQITGVKPIGGNRISHSNIKTKRKFFPNLFRRRFFVIEANQWITLKVSAAGLKSIDKKGLAACLKESYLKGLLPKKVVQQIGKKLFYN